jgi:hypothetical protein
MKELILKMERKTKVEQFQMERQDSQKAWSEYNDRRVKSLKYIIRPMLYILAIAGCYNFSDINNDGEQVSYTKSVLSKVYRLVMITLVVAGAAKYIACFFYLPVEYFHFNSLCAVWTIYIICIHIYNLKATSSRFGHYEKVFQFWNQKIVPDFEELGIEYPSVKLRKGVIVILIITIVLVLLNISALGVQISLIGGYLYTAPFETNSATLAAFFICMTAASLAWIAPIAFIICFTKLIQEAFKSLNKYKTKVCKQNGCKMVGNFQKFRLLHLNLCKLVSDLDEDLGWFYAIIFIFNIGLSVFTLYQIVKIITVPFEIAMFVFWCLNGLASIGAPAIYAAYVNDAVSMFIIKIIF